MGNALPLGDGGGHQCGTSVAPQPRVNSKTEARARRLSLLLIDGKFTSATKGNPWIGMGEKSVHKSDWPIQAPNVQLLDIRAMVHKLELWESRHVQLLRECEALLDGCRGEHVITTFVGDSIPESSLQLRLIQHLVDAGIVRELEPGESALSFVILHAVPEPAKKRFRVIADCLPANVYLPDLWKVRFRSVAELKMLTGRNRHVALFDFKAYYYQFDVHKLARYFAFRRGKRLFAFVRGVMGHKWMVAIAHSITSAFAEEIATRHAVEFDTIIDNVMFLSNDEGAVTSAAAEFSDLCTQFSITVGEKTECTQVFDYRGMSFDLVAGTVKLKESFIQKTTDRIQYVLKNKTVTKAQLQSLAGSLNWLKTVIDSQEPCWALNHALASLSNVSGNLSHNALVLSDDLRKELSECQALLNTVVSLQNLPVSSLSTHKPLVYLFTDACKDVSLAGKGIVLVTPLAVKEFVEHFTIQEVQADSIHILEIKALIAGIRKLLPNSNVLIFCDNEAVVKAMKRKRSSCKYFHSLIKLALTLLENHSWELRWIPSKLNWADKPSRVERKE
jgi:ribonuclease HI